VLNDEGVVEGDVLVAVLVLAVLVLAVGLEVLEFTMPVPVLVPVVVIDPVPVVERLVPEVAVEDGEEA